MFEKSKYSSLILLLGAGGALIYFWKKSTDDTSNVHGYYFGPSLSHEQEHTSSNDADEENDSDDLSLNSLSLESSPHKFLKKPLYYISQKENSAKMNNTQNDSNIDSHVRIRNPCPKCEKGTCRLKKHQLPKISSNSSSCYSGSPNMQMKTSTPEFISSEEDLILQRTVASNRLTYRFYRPGLDLRMKGDGSDKNMNRSNTTPIQQQSRPYRNEHPGASAETDHWP